jgi:hypothetical protein
LQTSTLQLQPPNSKFPASSLQLPAFSFKDDAFSQPGNKLNFPSWGSASPRPPYAMLTSGLAGPARKKRPAWSADVSFQHCIEGEGGPRRTARRGEVKFVAGWTYFQHVSTSTFQLHLLKLNFQACLCNGLPRGVQAPVDAQGGRLSH